MNDFDSTDVNMDRFLTVAEAAEHLKVSASDVHELIDSGELHGFRVGKRGPWRIQHDVLDQFVVDQHELARRSALWNSSLSSASNIIEL